MVNAKINGQIVTPSTFKAKINGQIVNPTALRIKVNGSWVDVWTDWSPIIRENERIAYGSPATAKPYLVTKAECETAFAKGYRKIQLIQWGTGGSGYYGYIELYNGTTFKAQTWDGGTSFTQASPTIYNIPIASQSQINSLFRDSTSVYLDVYVGNTGVGFVSAYLTAKFTT